MRQCANAAPCQSVFAKPGFCGTVVLVAPVGVLFFFMHFMHKVMVWVHAIHH